MNEINSAVSMGVQQYAKEVGSRLCDLPAAQRKEIERDITDRLVERSIACYDEAVLELGTSSAYAEEFRQAMELPPYLRVRRRRILGVCAVVVVLALAGGGLYAWLYNPVPDDYPLRVGATSVEAPGELVGSVIRMPAATHEQLTFGFVLVNDGDRTVRVDSVVTALHVEAIVGGISVGADGQPIFVPEVQIVPQAGDGGIVYSGFGVPPSFALRPFELRSGEQAIVMLRGSLAYCVNAPGYGTSDHPQVTFTVDGEERTMQGPEMAYIFGDCS